jgi:hypothetical protein
MSQGAFLSAPQLIKLITRGKTSKLSVEPLLEFFKPLSAWLDLQNKDEPVRKTQENSVNLLTHFFNSRKLVGTQGWKIENCSIFGRAEVRLLKFSCLRFLYF